MDIDIDNIDIEVHVHIHIPIPIPIHIPIHIHIHIAIVQWDICFKLRKETKIESSYLVVINIELIIEVKELLIAKKGFM